MRHDMNSNPKSTQKRSRGVILTEEALSLLDRELRRWWETSVEKQQSRTGNLTREQKAAGLGLEAKTVDKIYRREPVDERVLRDVFDKLKIRPSFTRERYTVSVLSPLGNLPRPLTPCIGRETEVAEIMALLESVPLVTLTGAGGVGKTRLAVEVAGASADRYPHGSWLVELAGVMDAAGVPPRVAATLGVQEESHRPLMQTLSFFLREKPLLLLLDNCEHLLDACATLAEYLLSACPDLKILATSRERLHLPAEHLFDVPSLAVPNPKELPEEGAANSLRDYAAVRLFAERAKSLRSDFAVTNQNAHTLASLCYRLDGIPLAIELAAACHRAMPLDELEKRLNDRFRLLIGGSRTAPPRHLTLRATMDWSYDLLETKQKALLGRLSVFVDGWQRDAAEQVCGGDGMEEGEVLALLTALVDKSLVVYQEREGKARYSLLETVRQYGWERLGASGEKEAVQRRHRDYFLALAEEAKSDADQRSRLRRLETEHGNLLAGLAWSLLGGEERGTLRLCGVLCYFWRTGGSLWEGRAWCERVLQATSNCREWPLERAKLLLGAAGMAHDQNDLTSAQAYYEESLALYRERGDLDGMARALDGLGGVATHQGNSASARLYFEESLALCRELEDWNGIARSLTGLGALVYAQGDYESARAYYEESLRISQRLGDGGKIANLLKNLGHVAQAYGEYEVARSYQEESLSLFRNVGYKRGIIAALSSLGLTAYFQGDYEIACVFLEEGIALAHEIGDLSGLACMLNTLGRVAQAQGEAPLRCPTASRPSPSRGI